MDEVSRLDVQERIIAIAFRQFRRFGIRRVSMSEIAGNAGISRTTLYRYFSSKSQIMELILQRQAQSAMDILRKDDNLMIKWSEIIKLKSDIAQLWGDILLHDLMNDPDYKKILMGMRKELAAETIAIFKKEQSGGRLNSDYAPGFLYELSIKLEYFINDPDLQKYYPDIASLIVAVLNIILDGIRPR